MFEAHTYNDWMQEVSRYLKGQSIEALSQELYPGIQVAPFAHEEKVLDHGKLYHPKALLTATIATNESHVNKWALQALSLGVSALDLQVSNESDLADIRLDYITPIIRNNWAGLSDYIKTHYTKSLPSLISDDESLAACSKYFYTMYEPRHEDPIQALVEILDHIESGNTKVVYSVLLGHSFYFEIARLRALRNLIHVLTDTPYGPMPYKIYAKPHPAVYASLDHQVIIYQSSVCLGASIGGADIIGTMPWSDTHHELSYNSQNILNILQHEVKTDRFTDVMGGSYFIEDLTSKVAHKVWDVFQAKKNKQKDYSKK